MGKKANTDMSHPYGKFDAYVTAAVNNTEKASELVAKSFYKILRKNGFNDAQIINVANNLLDCLIQTLGNYKEKKSMKNIKVEKTRSGIATVDKLTEGNNIGPVES